LRLLSLAPVFVIACACACDLIFWSS